MAGVSTVFCEIIISEVKAQGQLLGSDKSFKTFAAYIYCKQ